MARKISQMVNVAIALFEPRLIAKNRILIRNFDISDDMVEVQEAQALRKLVSFVVFRTIGQRYEQLSWEAQSKIEKLMTDLCADVKPDAWECDVFLKYDVSYISKEVIRQFIYYVHNTI